MNDKHTNEKGRDNKIINIKDIQKKEQQKNEPNKKNTQNHKTHRRELYNKKNKRRSRRRKMLLGAGILSVLLIVILAVKGAAYVSLNRTPIIKEEDLGEYIKKQTMQERGTEKRQSETFSDSDRETQIKASEPEKPEKLQTLDGIAAGTELDKENLDLENLDKYFESYEIKTTGASYSRIIGKSYQENPNVGLNDIRYLKVLHYNFNHQLQVGEIIVNKRLADEVLLIFKELYDAEYEIESMHLIDNYWTGDGISSDSASIDVNNTSAFNYRAAVGSKKLSNHAYGFAIDINPQQNPYVSYSSGEPKWEHKNANDYIDRDAGLPHMITHEDTAYKIFTAHGFKWGGDWNNPKDYQHFEKRMK